MHYLLKIANILLITDYIEIVHKTVQHVTENMTHAVDFLEELDNQMDDILEKVL
jgi:hypothetical protein